MKHERLKMSVDIQYLVEKKDMIAVFDGLIDPILCSQLIAELKPLWKAISREGQTAGGPMPLMKTSLDATLSASKMGDNWTETLGMIESKIYFHQTNLSTCIFLISEKANEKCCNEDDNI
jgi:hypothetical protein